MKKTIKDYVKKPVGIQAIKLEFTTDSQEECIKFCEGKASKGLDGGVIINTLEGKMNANTGDYIIKGIKGEFYPCKSDIFKMTYDEKENEIKNYIGVKLIKAKPMSLKEFENNIRNRDLAGEDKEGYFVEYEDGYQSWSPKDVFEEAYFITFSDKDSSKEMLRELKKRLKDAEVLAALENSL